MHLSSDAKDLLDLYNCAILTAMTRRLTRVCFGHTFSKWTFQVDKINHKNVVKRGMYRMRRLMLVFAIRTCTIQTIRPVWPNSLCRFLMIQKLSVWMGATVHKSKGLLFEKSLMVRDVYIHPLQNIGKRLVILVRGHAGWSASLLLQRLSAHYFDVLLSITLCFRLSRQVILWAQSRYNKVAVQ